MARFTVLTLRRMGPNDSGKNSSDCICLSWRFFELYRSTDARPSVTERQIKLYPLTFIFSIQQLCISETWALGGKVCSTIWDPLESVATIHTSGDSYRLKNRTPDYACCDTGEGKHRLGNRAGFVDCHWTLFWCIAGMIGVWIDWRKWNRSMHSRQGIDSVEYLIGIPHIHLHP